MEESELEEKWSASSFYFSFHTAISSGRRSAITGVMSSTTANTSNTADTGTIADVHRDRQLSAASYSVHLVSPKMGPRVGHVDRPLPPIHGNKGHDPKHQLVNFQSASCQSIGMLTKRKLSIQPPSVDEEVPQRFTKSATRSRSRTTGEVGYKNSGRGRQAKLVANYY